MCYLVYTGFVGDPLCSSMENNVHSLSQIVFFLGLTIKGSIQFSDIICRVDRYPCKITYAWDKKREYTRFRLFWLDLIDCFG